MAMIETRRYGPRDGLQALPLEGRVHELEDEFGDQIRVRSRTGEPWGPCRKPPRLEGLVPGHSFRLADPLIATLLITIIGWVATPIATSLIEKLFEKKEDTKHVIIVIVHEDCDAEFWLPRDNQKLIAHFRRREENSQPTSSAAG
jgi:hypothetical protein